MGIEKLVIEPTVGYMLKVLKSGKRIITFKDEFASIRHGNYFDFINQVKGEVPITVRYNAGEITVDNTSQKDDVDFLGLLNSEPSLIKFYKNCLAVYGKVIDDDISDKVYGKVVLFEIGLRMHASNNSLLSERETLESVINKLSSFKFLTKEETIQLHLGRSFSNMIKHPKGQFSSWKEGVQAFENAYNVLIKHQLTVY